MNDIQYYLEVANPEFLMFIKNMNKGLSKWIQYTGYDIEKNRIYFNFKSSQNSLNFKVYAGVFLNDNLQYLFNSNYNNIYYYFKELKYSNI
jgi:hypothetical protein